MSVVKIHLFFKGFISKEFAGTNSIYRAILTDISSKRELHRAYFFAKVVCW
jgi:hypothetical protein